MTMTATTKSWRDVLPLHPAAEMFPMMSADESKALGEDITRNGLRQKVVVYYTKNSSGPRQCFLVDGRNRLDAMEQAGLPVLNRDGDFLANKIYTSQFDDPFAFVISANIRRRHLTAEQKRDLIAKLMKAQPEKSNRQIAKTVKADDKTVGSVRRGLVATAEIPQLTKTVGRDGKARTTARKPVAKRKRRDVEDHIAEKKAREAAAKDSDAPAPAPHRIDPDELISQFTAEVRSRGLDFARQIDVTYRPRLIERLHEVIDEVELEAERWAREGHRPEEMPDVPPFLRRSAP
jgi:hypothetical protein